MIGPGLSALHKTASQKVTADFIPFNRPYATGKELVYAAEAQRNYHLSGDGSFTKRCHQWIEKQTGCAKALLTHSCTSALDMAALLLDIESGDEVILPSYTFVSTANAFVLRGAVPVFVDIREDTLNLDERLIEDAITTRTRAIVPVHYAGVSCEMESIAAIARPHSVRMAIWHPYHQMPEALERKGLVRRPIVPADCQHNGHMYYVLLAREIDRQQVLDGVKQNGIGAVFHYVPLHSSPAGRRYGRAHGELAFTTSLSQRLVRLPMWFGLSESQQA